MRACIHRNMLLSPSIDTVSMTYLALRAGAIDSAALRLRVGSTDAALRLVRMGHATANTDGVNTVYRLTPAGRAACPSRRAIEAEIALSYQEAVRS